MKKNILFILLAVFLYSCSVEPKPIVYGDDHCHFCDMTVVDKTHASQYTTKKGKSYSFDAVECLVRKLNQDSNEDKMAFILVANYANPGKLVNATSATFLVSEKIKSPMGANLSAFSTSETAKKAQSMHGGKRYTWQQIKEKLN
ncbi:MAG: nitrous oxide reductase accessory protein NosL [Flavobacteriales bacterium]|nr:nitrous oxide reductase accessory protein NosL [Flavobacteriales bacterium]